MHRVTNLHLTQLLQDSPLAGVPNPTSVFTSPWSGQDAARGRMLRTRAAAAAAKSPRGAERRGREAAPSRTGKIPPPPPPPPPKKNV